MREEAPKNIGGFSEKETEKLSNFADDYTLLSFLKLNLPEIYKMISNDWPQNKENFQNLCNVVAGELDSRLKSAGFNSQILEGDLEIAPKDWLVHRINMIKLKTSVVIVDLTSQQLPWFKNREWLLEIFPDEISMVEFLSKEYHWWIKDGRIF